MLGAVLRCKKNTQMIGCRQGVCCKSLELLICIGKRFRSFNKDNIEPVGQRASKLLPVKVGGLKKDSVALAEVCASALAQVLVRLGPNHSQSLMDSNFADL